MKTTRKTAKRLGTSLLCLSLFASSGTIMVNGIFAAPPSSPKPGQVKRSAQPIPTTIVEDKGTQQTGGVGSFFKGVGNKMKGVFKSDSNKPEQQEHSAPPMTKGGTPSFTASKPTPQQAAPKQTSTPQASPSQVTRNNPMRPNNVASVPTKPTEPNKLNSQMSGTQTNEVMKQLEELYKADGRTMPDMGALRDSHTETAQQVRKMDQKSTVRPSELSDNPLTKARAYIPGMDKPIETPKLVDKELPSILPETRVTAADVKASLPVAPGPAFVPPAAPEFKATPAPKVVKRDPVITAPAEDSMAWANPSPAAAPNSTLSLPPAGPTGMFPDHVASTKPAEVKPAPVAKPSPQHPLLDVAPAATVNKVVVSPPSIGMFPDPVSNVTTSKTPAPAASPKPNSSANVSSNAKLAPSLGAVGKFPGNEEPVATPATNVSKSTPKAAPKMDEDHFFVIDTESDEEDLDLGNDLVAKPASVVTVPAPKQPVDSSTAPYRPETAQVDTPKPQTLAAQPVKVETPKAAPKNQDSPFVAANDAQSSSMASADNPFKFPEGGLKDADEALTRAPKVEAKPAVEIKTADATPAFIPEAPKPKATESQPTPIPMVLPPAPTFPDDEPSVEKPAPETKSPMTVPAPKVQDKVAEATPSEALPKVEKMKESIDSDLVIEGDPAFSAMALAEAAAKASREQDELQSANTEAEMPTDAFVIPPLPGTADEATAKSSSDSSDDQPIVKFDDIPMQPSIEEKTAIVKQADVPVVMPAPVEKPIVAEPVVMKKPTMTPQQKYELISSRKNVRGFKGFCPVALRDRRELLDTDPEFQVLYQEKLYYFSSDESKRRFEIDPEHYLPASSGRDVVVFKDSGTIEEGMLDFAVWYQGRLYLFASKESMTKFSTTPSDYAVGEALIETTSH